MCFWGYGFYVILAAILFDIITGILVAAKERELNSSINREGLIRKLGELFAVVFVTFVDVYFQTNGVITKTGVSLLVIYEGMSIVENFGRIGVNVKFLAKYFDKNKIEQRNEKGAE